MFVFVKEFDRRITIIDKKSPNLYILIDYEVKCFFKKINNLNINEIAEYFYRYNDVALEVPNSLNSYILNSLILLLFKENKNNIFMKNFLSEYVKEIPRVDSEWRIVYWLKLLFGWVKSPLVEIDPSLDEANRLKNSVEAICKFIENNQNRSFPLHRNQTLCANLSFISQKVFSNLDKKGEKIYSNSSLSSLHVGSVLPSPLFVEDPAVVASAALSPPPPKFEQQGSEEEENDTRKFLLPPFPSVELTSNLAEDFQFPPPPSFLHAESVPPPPPFVESSEKKSSIAKGDGNSRKGLLAQIQSLRSEEGIANYNFKKSGPPKSFNLTDKRISSDGFQFLKEVVQKRAFATQYSSEESDAGAAASDDEWSDSENKPPVKLSLQGEKSAPTLKKLELAMSPGRHMDPAVGKLSESPSDTDSGHQSGSENGNDKQTSDSEALTNRAYLQGSTAFFKRPLLTSDVIQNNYGPFSATMD